MASVHEIEAAGGCGLWRGHVANAARRVLSEPRVHRKVGSINGESAASVLKRIMKAPYQPHPWDDL